jgi:predicted Zn finger-like uncharacterized protein
MLAFACPSCGAKLQMSEDLAGKKVRCSSCKGVITAPEGSDTSEAIQGGAAPAAVAAGKPHSKRGSDRDDDNDDRSRRGSGGDVGAAAGTAAAAGGLGIGVIIAIVGVLAVCLVCGVVGTLIGLLVPAVQKVREAAARTQTMNNMKQIGLAWHNYASTYQGKLPNPKLVVPPGTQSVDLSWRVSLLPYIEQPALYARFDQKSGWDSLRNQPLLSPMPMPYEHTVRDGDKKGTTTFWQYFIGPNTLWPDNQGKWKIGNIPDGTSNTFMFADSIAGAPWSKGTDMDVAPGQPLPLPPDRIFAAMCDGSVRLIDRSRVPEATLRLLIDPNDGQAIPQFD